MDSRAIDFSDTKPGPDEITAEAIGTTIVYVDNHPTAAVLAAYRAAGIRVEWVFEAGAFPEGYAAGAAAAAHSDRIVPADEFCYVVLWDGSNGSVSGHENGIAEYARGWNDAWPRDSFGGYGPPDALRAGQRRAPKLTRLWGIEATIPGSRGTGQDGHAEYNAELWRAWGAHVMQVYGGSPIADTDLDLVLVPWDHQGEPEVTVKLYQSPSSIVAFDGLSAVGLGPADLAVFTRLYGAPAAVDEDTMQDLLAVARRLATEGSVDVHEIAAAVIAALPAPAPVPAPAPAPVAPASAPPTSPPPLAPPVLTPVITGIDAAALERIIIDVLSRTTGSYGWGKISALTVKSGA